MYQSSQCTDFTLYELLKELETVARGRTGHRSYSFPSLALTYDLDLRLCGWLRLCGATDTRSYWAFKM